MKLLVVIPWCDKDEAQAFRLIEWIGELGGCPDNPVLMVQSVTSSRGRPTFKSFRSCQVISPSLKLSDESHPIGPNLMFETTLLHLIRKGGTTPFLWLEPDSVPLRSGWLQEIEVEYGEALGQNKTILAHVTKMRDPRWPQAIPSGVAVYPADAWKHYAKIQLNRKVAWDIQFADAVMPFVHQSTTITSRLNHVTPPTFTPGSTSSMRLEQIPKAAALFHPNKDGTLIERLRAARTSNVVLTPPVPIMLVTHDPMEPSGPYDCRGPETWKLSDFMATAPLILTPKNLPPVSTRPNRIIHVVQRWKPNDPQIDRRIHVAVRSWIRLYMTGEVTPCHVWPPYERDARGLGDARNLPYLRDILFVGLKAASKPDDIVLLTNDDNVLHPDLASVLFERLAKQPCLCAGRVNYKEHEMPTFMAPMSTVSNDIGRDLFAFRADWLKKNFPKIPDMLMGEAQFDIVLASLIRQVNGVPVDLESRAVAVPECELPFGWVQHEEHERGWMQGPTNGQKHNITTAAKWYKSNKLPHMVDFDYEK